MGIPSRDFFAQVQPKPRKSRFTGDAPAKKAWLLAQMARPGIFIEMRTVAKTNEERHWRVRQRRVEQEISVVTAHLVASREMWISAAVPRRVIFTRYAPRMLDPFCNLPSAFKAIQDAVARYYGVSDGVDSPIEWACKQEKSKYYAVRIEREW